MDLDLSGCRAICTICARGGSKGVKRKNTRVMHGVPLIAHTIRAAADAGIFDDIAVSSDSPQILQTAGEYGANILIERPADLASDLAAKLPAIRHCVIESEKRSGRAYDICVDLDATSPLRIPVDILEAVNLLVNNPGSNVISGCESRRSPYFNLVELNNSGYVEISKGNTEEEVFRRQDVPKSFDLNASIYAWYRDGLMRAESVIGSRTLMYEMPEERSLDIDSPLDWDLVEFIMARGVRDGS